MYYYSINVVSLSYLPSIIGKLFLSKSLKYWSCQRNNRHSTEASIAQPEQNLYKVLEEQIRTNTSPRILIFVGHSLSTQVSSPIQIWLNNDNAISITNPAFCDILRQLQERGLIFAAFFSCDGLKIAHELNKLKIPYILVSRYKIPVHTNLTAITEFLREATKPGVSINIALNKVRRHLQKHVETIRTTEGCPNASNLLVLFQNPIQPAYILRPVRPWWLRNRNLKLLVLGIFGIGLAFMLSQLWPRPVPVSTTACDDIRHIITDKKYEYLSCGEKSLLNYPNLNEQEHLLYETAKNELKKPNPNYSTVVENLEKLKDNNPEISIAYYNAQAKINLKKDTIQSIKTIAVMLPLSNYIKNDEADLPQSILTGVAQAQAQWNDDRKWNLEVVLVNDFNDPKNTDPVKFITEQPKILGATSNYNSSVTMAFGKKYSNNKLTVVSATNTAKNLTNIIPNYFRITVTTDIQAEKIIKFLYDKRITKVAIFSEKGNPNKNPDEPSQSVFADSFQKSLIDAGKKNNRINISIESDVFELNKGIIANTEANNIAKKGYQAVIINSNSFTNSELPGKILDLIGAISQSSPKCLIIGNEAVADSLLVDSMKTKQIKTDKLLFSLPWSETSMNSPNMKNHDDQNFNEIKLGNILIKHRAYLTYDAIYLLLDAINKGVKLDYRDQQIREDIPKLILSLTKDNKYFGMTGRISFTKERDRVEQLDGLVKLKFNENTNTAKFIIAQ